MTLQLTKEQRTRLFAADYRPLVFPHNTFKTKPCERGDVKVLSWSRPTPIYDGEGNRLEPERRPLFSLTVRRVVRAPDRWVVWFDVQDHRQRLRLLRSAPPRFDATLMKADQIHPPTMEEQRRAAEESAYTSDPRVSVDHLEAVDAGTLDRFAKEARLKDARNRKAKAERDIETLRDHVDRLREFGRLNGIDVRSELQVLERRLEEKLRKKAA